jgi:hypothetical protein
MKKFIALALCSALLIVGCSTQQWFQLVGVLIPIAEQTIVSFVSFNQTLGGAGLTPAQLSQINSYTTTAQTVFSDIGVDVASWTAANNVTTAQKITVEIMNFQTQTAALIPTLNLSDPAKIQAIEMFTTAILGDVTDILKIVPYVNGQPVATVREAAMATGLKDSNFQIVECDTPKGHMKIAVMTPAKLRTLQQSFAARHNAIRNKHTGDEKLDSALASVKKVHGPFPYLHFFHIK